MLGYSPTWPYSVIRFRLDLRDYFADAINAINPNFYQRLDNSKYFLEDKDEEVQTLNGVFNDPNYKDKDYFKQYPTIYHLRKELLQDDKPHDVRLVYLAIANIFKHRGHFLNSSLKADEETGGRKLHEEYQRLSMLLEEKYPDQANMQLPEISSDEVFAKFEELLGVSRGSGINWVLKLDSWLYLSI